MKKVVKCEKCGKTHVISECPRCHALVLRLKPKLKEQRCKGRLFSSHECGKVLHKNGELLCDGRAPEGGSCGNLIPLPSINRLGLRVLHLIFVTIIWRLIFVKIIGSVLMVIGYLIDTLVEPSVYFSIRRLVLKSLLIFGLAVLAMFLVYVGYKYVRNGVHNFFGGGGHGRAQVASIRHLNSDAAEEMVDMALYKGKLVNFLSPEDWKRLDVRATKMQHPVDNEDSFEQILSDMTILIGQPIRYHASRHSYAEDELMEDTPACILNQMVEELGSTAYYMEICDYKESLRACKARREAFLRTFTEELEEYEPPMWYTDLLEEYN